MAAFQPTSILIFGATGNIGAYITDKIADAQPPFAQVAIFTSENTVSKKSAYISELKSKGVKIITGDVTSEKDVKAAYEGIDTVVSILGRDLLDKQIDLIKLAEESLSIQWFFPSEYGTDVEYGPESANEKPHQLKLKVRRYLREHVKRLQYTLLVTGPYLDMFFTYQSNAPEAGGFIINEKKAVLVENGERKIGFTTMPE